MQFKAQLIFHLYASVPAGLAAEQILIISLHNATLDIN